MILLISHDFKQYLDFMNYVNHDKVKIQKCMKLLQHF